MDPEYDDITYIVTISVRSDESVPTESEVARALFEGVRHIDTASCVQVERQ